jgi:hypothetical protein
MMRAAERLTVFAEPQRELTKPSAELVGLVGLAARRKRKYSHRPPKTGCGSDMACLFSVSRSDTWGWRWTVARWRGGLVVWRDRGGRRSRRG